MNMLASLNGLLYDLVVVGGVGCAVFGAAAIFASDDRARRLRPAAARAEAGPSVRRGGSAWEHYITRPFKDKFVPSDEKERTGLNLWLLQAGYDSPLAAQSYYAIRIGFGVIVLPAIVMLAMLAIRGSHGGTAILFGGLIAMVVGFELPVFLVGHQRKARQRQVSDGLPDILDLLLVCTEAGLGLDTSIDRVGEETRHSQPGLSGELRLISNELRAGRQRQDAMRAFSTRTGVEEVRSLVNLLVQADVFGTSIAATLRVFSEDLRMRRLLRAEEAANKVTVKLSMILVGCFLPALVVAIMAPVLYHAAQNFHKIQM
ncbi:MAG TPA: type II secretion system F family protein [Stellaceae bacterium]|nr:type II secretion system F family protein [Stellaceae bacterium]